MRSRYRFERGFSLVELLVVVSIVAALAALALPSYQSARDRARLAQCTSNLRQIATGLFAYAADHDNALPPAMIDLPPLHEHNQQQAWGWAIWPYLYSTPPVYPRNCLQMGIPRYSPLDENVFHCPATRVLPVKAPAAPQVVASLFSYGLNSTPLNVTQTIGAFLPLHLSTLRRPSLAAMVVESSLAYGDCWSFFHQAGMIPHRGGTNVLYFDGHVDWKLYADVPLSNADTFWNGN